MKIKILGFLFIVFCLNLSLSFAQSRRVPQSDSGKKNARPAATPTPKTETTESQQTEETIPDDTVAEGDDIEVSTEIVSFPLKVVDRKGRFVTGLQKENFKVFEDNKEQTIEFFNNEEQPFTVALVLDMSYSATFKINEIQAAATAFINQLRKDDKVMVVSFTDEVVVWCEPTTDRQKIYSSIKQTKIGSGTSLYEAVDLVIKKFDKVTMRKAVVLFTDGVDTTSRRADYQSTIRDAEEADAIIYPLRYDTFADMNPNGGGYGNDDALGTVLGDIFGGGGVRIGRRNRRGGGGWGRGGGGSQGSGTSRAEYETGKRYLDDLARVSGGRTYEASNSYNLDTAFASIAEELRRQYSLGYYPENAGQAGDRKQIRVRVMRPNVVVRAKTSYIVGQGGNNFAGN